MFADAGLNDVLKKDITRVMLVLEGGPNTLQTAHGAMKKKTPVVVLAGSGRAADLIAKAVSKPLVCPINSMLLNNSFNFYQLLAE